MNKLDSRTEEEKQADTEHETMVKLETRSWESRRAVLESELAELDSSACEADGLDIPTRSVLREIARCDRALMELAAHRLPRR